jgi:hypothetical protein
MACRICEARRDGTYRYRCSRCYQYWRRHGVERPVDFVKTHIPTPIQLSDGALGIPLTRGYVAIVDGADADLADSKWCAKVAPNTPVYAMRSEGFGESRMHRLILSRMLGRPLARHPVERADHANGDSLDNRRMNVRLATAQQNAHNRAKLTNHPVTSRFKGVYWDSEYQKWRATITQNQRRRSLGRFQHEEDAARVYDAAALALHGTFARLNF